MVYLFLMFQVKKLQRDCLRNLVKVIIVLLYLYRLFIVFVVTYNNFLFLDDFRLKQHQVT